jgi:3-deoxy-D-arabino-heptulosonate 7-phosphate (DAHP) synthase class II
MARNQNLLEEGRERFEGALENMGRDWKRLQKRADQGRKQIEQRAQRQVKRLQIELKKSPLVKRAEEQRKLLERRARKLSNELRNSSAVKRAESLRKNAETRIEGQLESLFGVLRIASISEISRLERKVDQLNRKLRELEKSPRKAAAA